MPTDWIPSELKGVVTFFSAYDLWDYSNLNYHTCKECISNAYGIYQGNELRSLFPFLIVLDEDLISPDVHPNCSCAMHRVTNGQDERLLGKDDLSVEYDIYVEIDLGDLDFGGYW